MTKQAASWQIKLARAAAVVFAVGALGYLVATAQLEAQPSGQGSEKPEAAPEAAAPASEPEFLPSSKSGIRFLPSSKSMPIEVKSPRTQKSAGDR